MGSRPWHDASPASGKRRLCQLHWLFRSSRIRGSYTNKGRAHRICRQIPCPARTAAGNAHICFLSHIGKSALEVGDDVAGIFEAGREADELVDDAESIAFLAAEPASRWYAGAGIYRHVRLIVTNPVHIDQWGTFVNTPKCAADGATVRVQNTAVNQSETPSEVRLHWTPSDVSAHEGNVEAYSNCEEVELVLNGKSLGSKSRPADDAPRIWKVPFEPGSLKALGKNKGQVAAIHELTTAGKPAKIVLSADRDRLTPEWEDVSFVTATVVDDKGVQVPSSGDLIRFKVTGPGVIAAVDNGDMASHEPFQAAERGAYQGRCFAILKANAAKGTIVLAATAPNLAGTSVSIKAVATTMGK